MARREEEEEEEEERQDSDSLTGMEGGRQSAMLRNEGTSSSSMLLWCWRGCLGHDSAGMKLKENPAVHFQPFS
ncbi:hypothetical protein EYF80_039315 [Liparis tanakae]|uniref:Uncharacterized protein n=1 Tax=Liparis tanakae TaxID=230148 RepID=A0A4Z2GBP6_9TELE|nr:hypothetical protein EYF80_039315 [Liparis tanakae]